MSKKPLLTIFLIVFIDLLGFGIILPLLPFIAETYQATPAQVGLLVATYSFFQFIASPILGRLSDRYGRKKLLIISQIGSAVGFLFLGLAHSLPMLFISRIIDGITGGNISIAQAYIADITNTKDRAKGMGVIGAAFGLGFMLGPAIGGVLSKISFSTPAFFAAAIALITAITTRLFLTETINTKKAVTSPRTRLSLNQLLDTFTIHPLGLLIIIFFIINLGFSGMQGIFALWAERSLGFGPTQMGYMFTYIGFMAIIMQLRVLPFVIQKFGQRKTLIYSIPLLAFGFLLIPISSNWTILLISNTLLITGNSLSAPTIQAIASEQVDSKHYGGTLGILQSGASLGRIIGPIYAGQLFYNFNKDIPFISSGIIILFAYLITQTYIPQDRSPLQKAILWLKSITNK